MRRRGTAPESDVSFGSDSFLDVIANIVGILIILIVIVGVRVSLAPARDDSESTAPSAPDPTAVLAWKDARDKIEALNLADSEAYQSQLEDVERQQKEYAQKLEERKAEQAKLDKEYEKRLRDLNEHEKQIAERKLQEEELEQEIAAIADEIESTKKLHAERQQKHAMVIQEVKMQVEVQERLLAERTARLKATKDSLEEGLASKESLEKRMFDAEKHIKDLEKQKPDAKTLVHFGTPLAHRIRQREIYFRCLGGKIAHAPYHELRDRAAAKVRARISPSTTRIVDQVGPMEGFQLRFVVGRPDVPLSVQIEDRRSVGFGFLYAELVGESDQLGEDSSQVLAPNSAFRVKIRSVSALKDAITLLVYPDSFEVAKKAEVFLHEQGFSVGLRPMAWGEPIGFSPMGTATHSH